MKVLFLCLFLFSSILNADELSELFLLLDRVSADVSLTKTAIKEGEQRAMVCKYCHGKDGNSKREYIPNLASQSPRYLLRQFELFASKQRKDQVMSELAEGLTAEDRVNIALYYSSQQARPRTDANAELKEDGRILYRDKCHQCHGKKANGGDVFPRLASQPAVYLKDTLLRYRKNIKWRPESPMQSITSSLSDDEIEALVAYLSSLK